MLRLLTFAIVPFLVTFLAPAVQAGGVAPKKPSQLVLLGASGAACGSGSAFDSSIDAAGAITSFSIPAGQVLVLDHLTWSTSSATPGIRRIFLEIDGTSVVWLDVAGDENSTVGGRSVALPNIPVRSGHTICIRAGAGDSIFAPRLHGFLTKDG